MAGSELRAVLREFRSGEGFLYLGSSYRLSLVPDQEEPIVLKDGRFRLRRKLAEREWPQPGKHSVTSIGKGQRSPGAPCSVLCG